MSLKQEMLIQRLPANGYNISKTAREVGYTEQGSRAGTLYETLRRRMEKAFSPEVVKRDILKAEKDFTKDKDNSNRARMVELKTRVCGLLKDTPQQGNIAIFGDVDSLLKAVQGIPTHGIVPNTAPECSVDEIKGIVDTVAKDEPAADTSITSTAAMDDSIVTPSIDKPMNTKDIQGNDTHT